MRNGLSYSEAGKLGHLKAREKLDEYNRKFRKIYDSNPKKCKFCDKEIKYENRRSSFCNHSCAACFNNKGVNRHIKEGMEKQGLDIKKPKDVKYYFDYIRKSNKCLFCGKITKGKYCSLRCQQDYKWKITKEEIAKRNAIDFNAVANSRTARKYLKETRGIRCEICGITEWMSKEVPLVLDHISGNSVDWNLNNLRLICGNCDMQTDTYKGKNRGNGRFSRRLRYRTGKSY